MFPHSNELDELQQGIFRKQKIENMLSCFRGQLAEQQQIELQYQEELEKEQADYEKFNKRSIRTIGYSIKRSRHKHIEKERQDALAAQLKYDDIKCQIEHTRDQISMLEKEKMQYETYEENYNQLYHKKYRMLKESMGEMAGKAAHLEQGVSYYKSNIVEIDEAVMAGNQVLDKLVKMQKSLDGSEGFALREKIKAGLIDKMKRFYIDDTRNEVSEIQALLNRFRTELTDIKAAPKMDSEMEGLEKFSDFFLEGFHSDWEVRECIEGSLESIRNVIDGVNNILNDLLKIRNNEEKELEILVKELNVLIENAEI